jgi:hypothetical protein
MVEVAPEELSEIFDTCLQLLLGEYLNLLFEWEREILIVKYSCHFPCQQSSAAFPNWSKWLYDPLVRIVHLYVVDRGRIGGNAKGK